MSNKTNRSEVDVTSGKLYFMGSRAAASFAGETENTTVSSLGKG